MAKPFPGTLPPSLTREVKGVPVWAWGAFLAVGLGIALYMRKRARERELAEGVEAEEIENEALTPGAYTQTSGFPIYGGVQGSRAAPEQGYADISDFLDGLDDLEETINEGFAGVSDELTAGFGKSSDEHAQQNAEHQHIIETLNPPTTQPEPPPGYVHGPVGTHHYVELPASPPIKGGDINGVKRGWWEDGIPGNRPKKKKAGAQK